MPKPKIILWGNCQAQYLAVILRASPHLNARFEIKDYLNFSRPGIFEPSLVPDAELAACRVLIYHKIYDPKYSAAATAKLSLLPQDVLRIPLPYLKCNLYWPFFNSVIEPMAASPKYPWGLLPVRSPVLDAWLQKGLDDEAITRAFAALDPAEHLNLDLLEKDSYAAWKRLEAESEGQLKFTAYLMENWRSSLQFYIYNHSAKPLLLHLANQILARLDAPALSLRDIAPCACRQDISYPVHPGAARYYGLSFAKPGTRYGLGDKHYSFEEFIRFYLAAARAEAKRQHEET